MAASVFVGASAMCVVALPGLCAHVGEGMSPCVCARLWCEYVPMPACRCVVVLGLPYPNPSDPELQQRMAHMDATAAAAAADAASGAAGQVQHMGISGRCGSHHNKPNNRHQEQAAPTSMRTWNHRQSRAAVPPVQVSASKLPAYRIAASIPLGEGGAMICRWCNTDKQCCKPWRGRMPPACNFGLLRVQ